MIPTTDTVEYLLPQNKIKTELQPFIVISHSMPLCIISKSFMIHLTFFSLELVRTPSRADQTLPVCPEWGEDEEFYNYNNR